MTRTQFLDARRNVRKEIVAYVSIVIIGMLASLSFLGIAYSAATLKKDALHYFNSRGLWDLEVASTLLLDEEDLESIRALPGVAAAERVWQIDAKVRVGENDTNVSVMSLPGEISRPVLLEGRLPETPAECAVEKALLDSCGLSLGQELTLEGGAVSDIEPLLVRRCVITGVFQTPDHITFMVSATPYILVPEESFNREGLDGAFMKVRIRVEGAPEDRYGDAYREAVGPVQEALEALGKERAPARSEKLRGVYQAQIDEARSKLDEGKTQLEEAENKLSEGRAQMAEAGEFLRSARGQLDTGAKLLEDGERLVAEYAQLVRGLKAGGANWAKSNISPSELPEWFPLPYDAFIALLEVKGDEAIDWACGVAENKLAAYRAQVNAARRDWYYAGEEYLDAVTRYEQGLKQLEVGERQYLEGQAAWNEGEQRLQDALKKLEAIAGSRWVVLDDRGNAGFLYAESNFEKLSSLSMSFSSIFLVVGALVIYATVGRMVEQQRKLVGATKAMGLYNREVLAKYLYFACTATMLGVGLGVLLARLPLQRAILSSYEKLLTYGTGTGSFLKRETGLVVAGAFAISVLAVYLACGQLLKLSAIELMQGTVPSGGRKKARRSAKRNLFTRLIFRNMRTDLSRVTVTTVSIAGGCMLMMIGFSLRYGITGVPDRQFGGIQTYEAEVFFDPAQNADAAEEIGEILERNALSHVGVYKSSGAFETDGSLGTLTMIAAGKGSLDGFFSLRSLDGGTALELPDSGALVPRRFSEYYGLGTGDGVMVYDSSMELCRLGIAGVFENYYGQLFFLTPQSYEQAFSAAPEPNCFFVKTGGMSLDALRQELSAVRGVTKVSDANADRNVIGQFTAALNFVVWLSLFLAAMMACFIVANFTVTYVQRKTRELTIMRINGFSTRACVVYCAVDLAVTTAFGTLLGLVLGNRLGQAILRTTETPYIQMIREPAVQSFLFSALITCGFSVLINLFALRRIKDLKLADINS